MALHFLAENAFDDLLVAWREHWRVRNLASPSVEQLGRARIRLEEARGRMNKIRIAMYPDDDEKEGTLVGALCPVLDQFVYLTWSHQFGPGSRQLHCPCGELVPIPHAKLESSAS